MKSHEFIDNVVDSMESLIAMYAQGRHGDTWVGFTLDAIGLSDEQREKVLTLIRAVVGEATHSLICGIEGDTSLGKKQQKYRLFDQDGNLLTGELDSLLYERLEEQGLQT
jgi:hypothetical protein